MLQTSKKRGHAALKCSLECLVECLVEYDATSFNAIDQLALKICCCVVVLRPRKHLRSCRDITLFPAHA